MATTKTEAHTRNLYQRLNAIMKRVAYIQKEDRRVNNQYRFVSHDAVVGALRGPITEEGVFVETTINALTQDGNRTVAEVAMTFVNVDDPQDRLHVTCYGYGIDAQDKGPGKAVSYAVKYGLLKNLLLETGDDPERDDQDYQPTEQHARAEAPAPAPTPDPAPAPPTTTPPRAATPAPAGAEAKVLRAYALQAKELVERLTFPFQAFGESLRVRFGVRKFADLDVTTASQVLHELRAVVEQWDRIVQAARVVWFADADATDEQVAERARQYLEAIASETHQGRPLLAKPQDWQQWADELIGGSQNG